MHDDKILDAGALDAIATRTIAHYDQRADAFWEGTRNHDVGQNRDALLRHIDGEAPHKILDFGCGPGRDLLAFAELGHTVVGLDGSLRFCEMAASVSGCEVLHQNMLSLVLPVEFYDGVFANASLFHVPGQELPQVLEQLHRALVPGGVLFTSNPRGENSEGWNGERYGSYHDLAAWREVVGACGFEELEHYFRPPGQPRHLQPWLATVWRRLA